MVHQKILFTKEECDLLIDYRNRVKQTFSISGSDPNFSDISYKQWSIFRNSDLDFLFDKIISFAETSFDVKIENFKEESWIYQWEVNDGYGMHRDNVKNRKFIIGVQLNDNYVGGDLMVNDGNQILIVDKTIGNCYTFESAILHGVSPIISGNRFNMLTFFPTYNIKHNKFSLI
jgi:hypothetical protein